ncbi:TIGR01621 family pseudouridine synthase [Marinomonas sp. A79]|uniref:TIGR01621 family pseudouridine synthase n=1 Tax=Marinomonas vulgaris TaxID=2823372 RepID=A0ABS5H8C1_9GAMM|nr:TIGR01621 family pseudouridine synthase [Marinomonas vulgaris]MBR7887948.1 TIGR01621 family pseudouridine synthase [Marinomonas vulgaris]
MITVVYSCDDYWVIEKPAGMSFHAESESVGVMQYMSQTYPDHTFYPVHRLDKMTSGLLLVACNSQAAATFGSLFEQHLVEKRYLALSAKKPKKKQGTITGGMSPSRRGQWKLTKTLENVAETQFFSAFYQGLRVFYVRPLTGKTHQIRVALKSIGSPILGDARYSGEDADRGYLHAYRLAFEWQGEPKEYLYPARSGEYYSDELVQFVMTNFDEAALHWPSKK